MTIDTDHAGRPVFPAWISRSLSMAIFDSSSVFRPSTRNPNDMMGKPVPPVPRWHAILVGTKTGYVGS